MDANGQERPIEEDGLGQRETGTGPCEFGFGWFMLEMCFRRKSEGDKGEWEQEFFFFFN